jgi:hypothetical protein
MSIFVLNLVPSTASCSSNGLLRYGSINWLACGRNTPHFPVVKLFENSSRRKLNRHARPDNILVNRVKNNVKRIKEMLRYLIHSSLDQLGLKPLSMRIGSRWAPNEQIRKYLARPFRETLAPELLM